MNTQYKNSDTPFGQYMTRFTNPNAINAPESDYLYTAVSQLPNAGMGLFTAIKIYKEEILSCYTGEIITQAEAKIRAAAGQDRYFINLPDHTVMDSMSVIGFAKFANDAAAFPTNDFRNNARITLDEVGHPVLTAMRNIKSGEEIFCSYGKRYWKKHSFSADS